MTPAIIEHENAELGAARKAPRMRRRRWAARHWLFAATTACLAVATSLAATEAAVRLLAPRAFWAFHDSKQDWQPDDQLGWAQRCNHRAATIREDGVSIVFATNADGVRPAGAVRARTAGRTRILLLGDSTAVGRSVRICDTLTAQLEREFARRGFEVEAINAGVEGFSTDQESIYLRRLAPLYTPDIVLLCVCSNDHGANHRSSEYGINKPRFELDGMGRLQAIAFEKNDSIGWFGTGPKQWIQFSAAYRLVQPSIIRLRAKWRGDDLDARLGFSPWYYVKSRPDLGRIDWKLFTALLDRMNSDCMKQGSAFAFFGHPALEEVWDPYIESVCQQESIAPSDYDRYALESHYLRVANERGLTLLRLIDHFRGHAARGPFHLLPRDPHCNENGYRWAAVAIVEQLLANPAVKNRWFPAAGTPTDEASWTLHGDA